MAQTFTKPSISHETAQKMVAAAVAKAQALGVPQVVAVLDESGLLKAFCRMDGVTWNSGDRTRLEISVVFFSARTRGLCRMTPSYRQASRPLAWKCDESRRRLCSWASRA